MDKIFFDPKLEFFAVPKDVTIAATSNADFSLDIPKGNDFWVTMMTFYAAGAAAGDLSIKFSVSGRNNSFINGTVKTDLLFGDGKQPFELPVATRIPGGSSVVGNIANGGGSSRVIQVCLIGYNCPPGYVPQQFVDQVNARLNTRQVITRGITK